MSPFWEWVSPIVVLPNMNGKLKTCQDFCKLKSVTRNDHFPFPFTNTILDVVVGHRGFSLMDGSSVIIKFKCIDHSSFVGEFTFI